MPLAGLSLLQVKLSGKGYGLSEAAVWVPVRSQSMGLLVREVSLKERSLVADSLCASAAVESSHSI